MSIALNSISKFKERDLPTMLDDFAQGLVPAHMCFAMASLIKFYDGYRLVDGKKEEIKLADTPEYLVMFRKMWDSYYANKDVHAFVVEVLGIKEFWGRDLNAVSGFEAEVEKWLKVILDAPTQMDAIKTFLGK
jgi:tagaturonate reductase